jgi:hypothetical protein
MTRQTPHFNLHPHLVFPGPPSNGNFSMIVSNTNSSVPDYFIALLHNRLVGQRVLNATSDDNDVLVYAHCTQNRSDAVTLMYTNPSQSSKQLELPGASGEAEVYIFTAPHGDVQSHAAEINGKVAMLDSSGQPPAIASETHSLPLTVPAQSYGFIVLTDLGGDACAS